MAVFRLQTKTPVVCDRYNEIIAMNKDFKLTSPPFFRESTMN